MLEWSQWPGDTKTLQIQDHKALCYEVSIPEELDASWQNCSISDAVTLQHQASRNVRIPVNQYKSIHIFYGHSQIYSFSLRNLQKFSPEERGKEHCHQAVQLYKSCLQHNFFNDSMLFVFFFFNWKMICRILAKQKLIL